MKKIILFLLLVLPVLTNAQITINSSHLPSAGQSWVEAYDDNYSAPMLLGGAAQNWNYSGLLTQGYDTTTFISAAATPYGPTNFPGSNLAIHNPDDSLYIYVTKNTSGLYIDGYYFYTAQPPFGVNAIPFIPHGLFLPTPFTYNDTRSNTYKYVIDIDTALPYIRFVHQVNQDFLADGYGALQLPNATYNNTLRVRNTELTIDSLLIDTLGNGNYFSLSTPTLEQKVSYNWFRTNQPAFLLSIDADSLGNTATRSNYMYLNTTSVQELPVAAASPVRVYPNPSNNLVQVLLEQSGNENNIFRLCDVSGRVIRETSLEGINQLSFYVNKLAAGTYFWSISGLNAQGKLMVE